MTHSLKYFIQLRDIALTYIRVTTWPCFQVSRYPCRQTQATRSGKGH